MITFLVPQKNLRPQKRSHATDTVCYLELLRGLSEVDCKPSSLLPGSQCQEHITKELPMSIRETWMLLVLTSERSISPVHIKLSLDSNTLLANVF